MRVAVFVFLLGENRQKLLKTVKVGEKLNLKNVYVKKGFGGKLELSTRSATVVSVVKA